MDPILQIFLSWQFVVFSLAIASIIFVIRTTVEYFIKNTKFSTKKMWQDLFLPILPVLIGALFAFLVKSYPYPNNLTSTGNRVVFGVVAGLLSGLLYRVIKSLVSQKIGSESEPKN